MVRQFAAVVLVALMLGACASSTAPTPQSASTLMLSVGSTLTRAVDEMVMIYVPAGKFKMGSETGSDVEKPVHDVTLDAFWIDGTEVTNAQYAKCVSAGKCAAPAKTESVTRSSYYGNPQYADFPVIYVSWDDAYNYCMWAGGQLPTEAQWEYTAGGPQGYTYPWGNDQPNDTRLNYNFKVRDTTAVGSYPSGASWVGAFDLAGNVWEWVQDRVGPYSSSAQTNPTGPTSGIVRLGRGGSWYHDGSFARATSRVGLAPDYRVDTLGFRCVVTGSGK